MLKYEIGAIEDWKEGNISNGVLFHIFRVSFGGGYRALLDKAEAGRVKPFYLSAEDIYDTLYKVFQKEHKRAPTE